MEISFISDIKSLKISEETVLPASIYECTVPQIVKHFTNKSIGQSVTHNRIAYSLYDFIASEEIQILPMIFAGDSDTGKTRSCEIIKELLQLKEREHIRIDIDRLINSSKKSIIYRNIGYPIENSLVYKLLEATGKNSITSHCNFVDIKEEDYRKEYKRFQQHIECTGIPLTKQSYEFRQAYFTIKDIIEGFEKQPPLPKIIMLEISGFEKICSFLLSKLISLIEDGELLDSGKIFRLPKETKLLIIFLGNYITDNINDNNYDERVDMIYNDMIKKGIEKDVLDRLFKKEYIMPFSSIKDYRSISSKNMKI